MMKKEQFPNFRTQKQHRFGRSIRILLAFMLSLLVFGGASFFYMLHSYDYDLSRLLPQADSTSVTDKKTPPPSGVGNAVFLLVCRTEEGEDPFLTALLFADIQNAVIHAAVIPPKTLLPCEGGIQRMDAQFEKGGIPQLRAALEAEYERKIDRYLLLDSQNLQGILQQLGGVRLNIPERIDHRSEGLTLLLIQGEQTLRSDSLLKYMRYLNLQAEKNSLPQAQLLCTALSQYLNKANVEKGESIYQTIVNSADCDITVLDFAAAQKSLEFLADPNSGFSVKPYGTVLEFPHEQ